ncbi:MAG: hypothetical protein HC850_07810 [Rhodomicrobium sp.]|nr:hypothetical protein [Rhodomicrobium sp.]
MTLQSTAAWLKTASILVMGFGIAFAAGAHPSTDLIARFFIDLVFWPIDGAQSLASPEARLLCAISGGLTFGLGAMLWLIAARLFPHNHDLARSIMIWGVGSWFVVDSTGSVLSGAPLNVALNLVILLLFLIPLSRPAKAMAV